MLRLSRSHEAKRLNQKMPFNATTTCAGTGSTTICTTLYGGSTSTTASVINGFTYGEIFNGSILLLVFLVEIYFVFYRTLKSTKTR
jgi:hypothetical protein